jgi:DNA-binding GntR family transcriptional regulator
LAVQDLPEITRSSIADTTADMLRERILDGVIPPGSRLIEADIARQLRTSRGPVREALVTLRAEGLARDEPGRGSYVSVLSPRDVEEIYEVRAGLESAAALLVIEQGRFKDLDRLDAALAEMRRTATLGDRTAFVDADLSLHDALCRLAGNDHLYRAWTVHVGLLRALIRMELTSLDTTLEPLILDHDRLVQELRSGDLERATRACWALFRNASRLIAEASGQERPATLGELSTSDQQNR